MNTALLARALGAWPLTAGIASTELGDGDLVFVLHLLQNGSVLDLGFLLNMQGGLVAPGGYLPKERLGPRQLAPELGLLRDAVRAGGLQFAAG